MTSLKQLSHEWYLATALYDAIDDENLREITNLVQERHASPNVIIPDYGYTPLHLAVGHENEKFGKEVTKILMKNGGDPNVTGIDGVTPIHVAVAWNRSAVVRLLLSYGADPWMKDDSEKDAFDYANEQQAWDTLRALEALKHSKSKENLNHKLHLDKVIVHSNDIGVRYKAENTPLTKQSVSTQTPGPFVRSPLAETDELDSEVFESSNSGSHVFDSSFDWCEKSNGVVITDECKRTIYRHRARSNTYEYSPRRSASVQCDTRIKIQETRKRFFPQVCCAVANDVSMTDDYIAKDFSDENYQSAKEPKKFFDYKESFSDDSLMTDDQSCDSKSVTKDWNFSTVAKDIPFIDETTSDENASQKMPDVKETANTELMQVVPKETVRHVSWPECLSTCACIPSYEDDDSFTMYSSSQDSKKKSELMSGVHVLEKETNSSGAEMNNVSVEYKYTDDEDGIEFIETKMPFSHSNSNKAIIRSSPEESDLSDLSSYDTDYIRRELKKVGFISGPIAGSPTKKLYLRKLRRLKRSIYSPMRNLLKQPGFSSELEQLLSSDDWIEKLSKWSMLEKDMRDHFQNPALSLTWRNGTAKMSFTYLLVDPRISNNLPARCEDMKLKEVWRTFVRSIFYIGKGIRARPYKHLHDAFDVWHRSSRNYSTRHSNLKISYILDIWKEGLGVVCVQTFHNLIPAEALTREAAMIDAVGLARLKNEKGGAYHGVAAKWNAKLKRRLGCFLLYRAMKMFIADNEVQIKPADVT